MRGPIKSFCCSRCRDLNMAKLDWPQPYFGPPGKTVETAQLNGAD